MTRPTKPALRHEFVEYVPEVLDDGVLYVSLKNATIVHKCCCGCTNEVVTPLSPTDWQITFDGESISLNPSIGNWSFRCQSHYWIRHNRIEWDRRWSPGQIEQNRRLSHIHRDKHLLNQTADAVQPDLTSFSARPSGLWNGLKRRLGFGP